MKISALIALLLLPIGGLSAQVAVFEHDWGQPTGNVLVAGSGARPADLQGIQLLPIEVVGRTRLTELLPGSTRHGEIPSGARLILPFERGSLYKFSRVETGQTVFGFFLVEPNGNARSVFELPGTGVTRSDDPLPGRVAVGPAGLAFLVASSVAAGGDLWEVDLAMPRSVNRTPDLPPRSFKTSGLAFLGTWGLGVADEGVYRFKRAPGARASAVRIPTPLTTFFAPDVVTSADQSTVAFVTGENINRALVFTCRQNGDAVQASETPARIPGAGFLPEVQAGPHLALSTDGSWVAWRREASSSECFVRKTRASVRPPDAQITGPTHFDNTLNDTGVIAFFSPDSFVLMVGRRGGNGIERGDVYRVDVAATSFTASNLSRTSGILVPPFDYGTMETMDGLFQLPGTGFLGRDGNLAGKLVRFDANGATETVLDQVQSLDSLDLAGNHVVAQVTRPPGVDLPLDESLNLVQVPTTGSGAMIIPLPFGCRISRESSLATRDLFGGVLELEAGGEWLGRLLLPTPSGAALSTTPMKFGPTTAMGADGTLFASILSGQRQLTLAWSDLGVRVIKSSPAGSFLLPAL